jgi:glycosyltransferase involved in cell wall biosynthesis
MGKRLSSGPEYSRVGISLILLSYNEIEGTRALIHRIPFRQVDECFAVDGGSTDGTRELLRESGVKVVDQTSKGRGEAFRIAFDVAQNDNLIFFSLDGNEDPNDIPHFRKYFDEGYDMVIASRMCRGARNEEDDRVLKVRKWANNAFNWAINAIWNRRGSSYVTDSINGFRGITRKCWQSIRPDGVGYTIEYQSTIRALKLNLRVAEFPTIEGQRIGGQSNARAIPTGLRFLRLLFKEIMIGKNFIA